MKEFLGVSGLEAIVGKKIAFYQMMEGTDISRVKNTSPSTLQFIAFLEKQGHTVDYFIYELDLLKAIDSNDYDIVGLSGGEDNFSRVYSSSENIKKLDPRLLIAVGGYVAAGVGENLIRHPAIDAVFEGESEYIFPLFLKHLNSAAGLYGLVENIEDMFTMTPKQKADFPFKKFYRSPISIKAAEDIMNSSFKRRVLEDGEESSIDVGIANVFFKDITGKIHIPEKKNRLGSSVDVTPLQGELDDLLDLPWWTSYAKYTPGLMQNDFGTGKHVSWEKTRFYFRRGCAGTCDFCSIHYNSRIPSAESVVAIIEKTESEFRGQIPKRKPSGITFGDDSFTQSRNWALNVLNLLKEKSLSYKFNFNMQQRVVDAYIGDDLDVELLDALADNSFTQGIGVETMHGPTAEYLGKVGNGRGENYVRKTRELVLESLKRNIPTTLYTISITPNSTLDSVADDYLEWASLAREAYEITGRVYGVHGNIALIPNLTSKLAEKHSGLKNCQPENSNSSSIFKDGRIGDVVGDYYPTQPLEGGGSYGVFNPNMFVVDEDLYELQLLIQDGVKTGSDRLFGGKSEESLTEYINYISVIGSALCEIAENLEDIELMQKGEKILEDMAVVLDDKLGKRERQILKAKESFDEACWGDHLPMGDSYSNLNNRFYGKEFDNSGEFDMLIDEIAGRPGSQYEDYRMTRDSGIPDSYFYSVMSDFYRLLSQFGCDYSVDMIDDIDWRMSGAKESLKEYNHGAVVFEHRLTHKVIEVQKFLREYPDWSKKVRKIHEKGFPPVHTMSGIMSIDPNTGIKYLL